MKKNRRKGQDRIKGDQRVLGDRDFVTDVLVQAEERFNRSHELKNWGYALEVVETGNVGIYSEDPSSSMDTIS